MSSSALASPDLSAGVFTDATPRNVAVSVRGLSKSYRIAHNAAQHTTAGEALMHRLRNPFQKTERETFWALNDVNFDIQKGDVVGIIGHNGAGKSTLLKILSRITSPTKGRVDLYGRVGSLLEVGTGFHPELTGRENIFLNGAIMGMSKAEIARQFDAIVDFSGTEKFMDTPVKRYSSGMYVRLAYAVAAHLRSSILIIDEVLAVGDTAFQQKCLSHMQSLTQIGVTILLVSHNLAAIQSCCDSVIFLEKGRIITSGPPLRTIEEYRRSLANTSSQQVTSERSASGTDDTFSSVKITGFDMFGEDGGKRRNFSFGERLKIRIEIEANEEIAYPLINFGLRRGDGIIVCNFNNWYDNFKVTSIKGKCILEGWLPSLRLIPGYYEAHVLVWPWGGPQSGDMRGASPAAADVFGDFCIEGIGLNSQDGVFQIPARKWKLQTEDGVEESADISSCTLSEALNIVRPG